MVIVPDSDIILIKSPLKLDNYNQITFNNATDQYNYFHGLTHLEYDDCTYQRKDGVIRFSTDKENPNAPRFEDLLKYNYCMYKNDSYKDKWFYAFVTDIKYINDGMSEVTIETDVFQTWQFDIVYKNSFVEREHVSDDTIGKHTLPEGLETGDYIINNAGKVTSKLQTCYICMAVTWIPENTPDLDNVNRIYNNIYSGTTLVLFRNADDCSNFIKCYDKMGHGDAITNLYMIPISATGVDPEAGSNVWKTYTYDSISTSFCLCPYSTGIMMLEQNLTYNINSTINGYTPKNNKLFTFPYNYLSISNNNGTQVDFKYEDFINAQPIFDIGCCVTAGGQNMMIPKNYKLNTGAVGYDIFYTYGIAGGKFPTCSWNTDPYTNWLTQNGVNILGMKIDAPTSQAIGGSLEALVGGATKQSLGVASGFGKMLGAVQENWRHSLQSPTLEGQTSCGDYTYAWGNSTFTYYRMSIKREYAMIIDDFFTLYGYKVNDVKTPNIHQRSNWDFIKCSDVNLEGDIPEKDLDKIRSLFNNGCTFWHTTTYYLDYTRTNAIV